MNAIEQYIKGEGKDEGNLKPKTVMECYLSGLKRPSFPKYSQVIEAYLGNKYAFDAWKEEDHPRDKDGKFGKGGGNSSQNEVDNISKDEYGKVMHELNNNLTKEQRKKKRVTKEIGNYRYTVINKGFNEYKIIGKEKIDGID